MEPGELLSQIYKPRILAWIMAGVMLATAFSGLEIPVLPGFLLVLCLGYPHVMHLVLSSMPLTTRGIRCSMLVDAVLVGLLIAVLGFSLNAGAVLLTLMLASILIVGGLPWLLLCLAFVMAGAVLGAGFLPDYGLPEPGAVSYAALLLYISMIALLVYRETRMLYAARRQESRFRHQVQDGYDRLMPYVAPQVIRQESDQPERKRLTVLFSDIEGFTRLMDEEDETEVAAWLNRYLEVMTGIAATHGGTVDKFLGDGLMVYFGDLADGSAVVDAYACVSMALEMRDRMQRMTMNWRAGQKVHIRIGIHTGYCLIGGFGSSERKDYTAIGGAVNLASRIEGQAGSDEILISDETRKLLLPWVSTDCVGCVPLKGIAMPVSLFRVDGLKARNQHLSGELRILR